jgi:hypothetical protein
MTASTAAAPPTLLQLIGRVLLAAMVHGPVATVLAAATVGVLLLLTTLSPRVDLTVALVAAWLLASHAFFIAFLAAFAAGAPPLRTRIAEALQPALRALPHLALLIAATAALARLSPLTFLAVWTLAAFVAAPSHFAAHGWRGWTRWPRMDGVTATQRIVLIAPSLAFLAAMVAFIGASPGGAALYPLLGTTTFWASYSCALLSAEFRRSASVNGG